MMFLKRRNNSVLFISTLLVSVTIFNMELCKYAIAVFLIAHLIYFKDFKLEKKAIIPLIILASPFLIDLLLIWHNNSIIEGWHRAEKRLVFLIFPLFLLGFKYRLELNKFIRIYSITMPLIMIVSIVAFQINHPDLVAKYLQSIHLWEMGYMFSSHMGIHAPFLNLQMAFVTTANFYFLIDSVIMGRRKPFILNVLLFVLSFFFVLIVNTRLALVLSLICMAQILFSLGIKKLGIKKTSIITLLLGIFISTSIYFFIQEFPYYKRKFEDRTFAHMDLIGKLDEINEPNKGVFLASRLTMWQSAFKLGSEKPMLGYGTADARLELFKYYQRTNQKYLQEQKMPIHNQYLDFFLKEGVVGVIVFLTFLLFYFKVAWRSRNPLAMSLFILLTLSCITEDVIIRFWGIAFFALFMTLFTKDYLQRTNKSEPTH